MLFLKKKKHALITFVIIIMCIVIIIILVIRKHKISYPLLNIRADSTRPEYVDISWQDEEKDAIYAVYWSHKKAIIPNQRSTFTRHTLATGTKIRIHAPYQYVYFRIVKQGFKSDEYEIEVMSDTSFNLTNLGVKVLKRGNPMTLTLNVLQNADIYRIYHKLPTGETISQDFHVKGLSRTNVKIQRYDDAFVYVSYIRDDQESELRFVLYNEKISLNN
jgi:hypothetical protein